MDPAQRRFERFRRRVVGQTIARVYRDAGAPVAPAPLPVAEIHRIVVCRSVHRLGSALIMTPLLNELEQRFPGAEIDLLGRCAVASQVFSRRFSIGRIIELPDHAASHPWRASRALQLARHRHYDLAIDPDLLSQGNRLMALLVRARYSLGFRVPDKRGALTHLVDAAGAPRHRAQAPVYLLRQVLPQQQGMRADAWPCLDIRLDDAELRAGQEALRRVLGAARSAHGCIAVFANATGAKRLERAWWDRFLPRLESAMPARPLIEILPAEGGSLLGGRYPGYYTSNLRRMAAVIANCAFFIGADSGVMHLACASGAPTIGLFNGTDPGEWGPYGRGNLAIVAKDRDPEWVAADVAEAVEDLPLARRGAEQCPSRS